MGLFRRLSLQLFRPKSQTGAIAPQSSTGQLSTPATPGAIRPKTLTELEREIEAQSHYIPAHPVYVTSFPGRRHGLKRLIWITLLLGLPIGALWFVNLPYPMIRRPVARTAPILLLPSYVSFDHHYREAISLVEQADQLISQPTSAADIELGAVKVKQAKDSLDALPLWFLNDFPDYSYWWYDWRFSNSRFNAARARVGELEVKAFQEKNAQTALFEAEQTLVGAKQSYQQAQTSVDKQMAIANWQSALDQMQLIPGQTLAGRMAQQKLVAYQREFQETVGLAASNERIATLIESARQFSWKAAQAGQNPPHSVEEWRQVAELWQEAITRLERIPSDDLTGYAEAQKLLAEYRTNLGQIEIRRRAEETSVSAFQQAQRQIEQLQASVPVDPAYLDRNQIISQLQSIINQLQWVEHGTTVYLEAQELLLFAQNKLAQL